MSRTEFIFSVICIIYMRIFSSVFKIIFVLNGTVCHILVCSKKEMSNYLSPKYTPDISVMRLISQPLIGCQLQLQGFVFDFLIHSVMMACQQLKCVAGFVPLTLSVVFDSCEF